MKKTLYSATDILKKNIPGLPTSRSSLLERASDELWYAEERTGLGGKHKVYEIPARYLEGQRASATPSAPTQAAPAPKAAKSAPVSFARDQQTRERMLIIMEGLETFLAENELSMQPDRKVFLVDVLYRYFELEGVFSKENLAEVIKKLA